MKNNETLCFRKATIYDADKIWEILQQGILRRKQDGSNQWQDGYPNEDTAKTDIEKGIGYVLTENDIVVAYCAIISNYEPAYDEIEGKWLTNGDYNVVHRGVVSNEVAGKGYVTELLKRVEQLSKENDIFSIKVDTNFDNLAMLHILNKLGYVYCGEVYFRGSARKAFEKVLS